MINLWLNSRNRTFIQSLKDVLENSIKYQINHTKNAAKSKQNVKKHRKYNYNLTNAQKNPQLFAHNAFLDQLEEKWQ